MRLLKSLILVLITTSLSWANTKISECAEGWGVYTEVQSDVGSCGLPVPDHIGRVSLSTLGINQGRSCGECYEVFGPSGSTVVMAFDSCDAGAACKQNDTINFILSKTDFNKIGGKEDGNIYSMGYQKVSCQFETNIKANFIKPGTGSSNYQYYFGVTFSEYDIAIDSIGIKGNGMSVYQQLERHSNQFNFNKKDKDLFFPATLALKSVTGQVVTYTFESAPPAGVPIDLKVQFKAFLNTKLEGQCGMGVLPKYLYKDSLEFGWYFYESWDYGELNFGAKESGASGNVTLANLNAGGGIKFTRPGGFDTGTLDQIMFTVKSNVENPQLGIYFSTDANYTFSNATSTWGTYAINVSSLQPTNIEYSFIFINRENKPVTYWFDNIQWIFKDGVEELPAIVTVAPDPNAATKKPTTGSATGSGTGSFGSGGITSGGDDSEVVSSVDNEVSQSEHSNSASSIIVSLSVILLSIIFNILL